MVRPVSTVSFTASLQGRTKGLVPPGGTYLQVQRTRFTPFTLGHWPTYIDLSETGPTSGWAQLASNFMLAAMPSLPLTPSGIEKFGCPPFSPRVSGLFPSICSLRRDSMQP